jgi:hypothetical protein
MIKIMVGLIHAVCSMEDASGCESPFKLRE